MTTYSEYEQTAIDVALAAIQQTLNTNDVMTSSEQVRDYLTIQLAGEPDEWFGVMFLTSQHRLSSLEKQFSGWGNKLKYCKFIVL
jgi:DNA repair protein RadC